MRTLPNQDPVQESDQMGLTWGSVAMPRELKSTRSVCRVTGATYRGFTHVGRTGHRADQAAHARRAADGLVRVDAA